MNPKTGFVILILILSLGCSSTEKQEVNAMDAISISSGAFENGGIIPARYTCDGENVSPELSWSQPPAGTVSFALISDDPDAPGGTFVHWTIFNIPADKRELEEGMPRSEVISDGSIQGITSYNKAGYRGPCPPSGKPHRYSFKIYVLDTTLDLTGSATKREVEAAMEGHILAKGELLGMYGR
jgi:Raf kinase inhibitor-like YbhB/YbcL family protein